MLNKLIAMGLIGAGSIFGIIGGIIIHKTNSLTRRFDTTVKNIENLTVNDIEKSIIEQAVQKAADEKVGNCIQTVKAEVMADAKRRISDEVRKAVMDAKEEIEQSVTDCIGHEASLIDMDDLRKSARKKAEEKILSKFDGNLEDLLQKFNENLSNVQKIYGGIADAIGKTNKSTKEIKFSLD